MNITETIEQDIEDLREMILEIDDRIWRQINHQDAAALNAFVERKTEINSKITSFQQSARDLLNALSTVQIPVESEPYEIPPENDADETISPIDRSFRFTKPKAMILEGERINGLETWQAVWKRLLSEFLDRHPEMFNKTLVETSCIAGNAEGPEGLITSYTCGGRHFECTLSADAIAQRIRTILLHSQMRLETVRIVLQGNPDLKGTMYEGISAG